ncbi:MAG: hypothetical protein ACKVT2_21415 [Saprospiraceae bacterium]
MRAYKGPLVPILIAFMPLGNCIGQIVKLDTSFNTIGYNVVSLTPKDDYGW